MVPITTALGVTFMVIGTTIGWWLSIVGLIITVLAVRRWIMDTRRDVAALPEEHGH
jgi:dolichyl-phosphate-mannose--protein O-mannosyl transferase